MRVHIAQTDFGRGYQIFLIDDTEKGKENIAAVDQYGRLQPGILINEGEKFHSPTLVIEGHDAFEWMREFALAFVRAGFIATNPHDVQEKLHREHVDSLKEDVQSSRNLHTRHLNIIEKLLETKGKMLIVPEGTHVENIS